MKITLFTSKYRNCPYSDYFFYSRQNSYTRHIKGNKYKNSQTNVCKNKLHCYNRSYHLMLFQLKKTAARQFGINMPFDNAQTAVHYKEDRVAL